MTLREKIFDELKRLNFGSGYVWKFQQYHGTFRIYLNPLEQKNFYEVMNELCNEGVFEIITNGDIPTYRLTDIGEKIVWSE